MLQPMPKCDLCGRRKRVRLLLAKDSTCEHDLVAFLFCWNYDCPKGPKLIRSLSDGA